MIDIKSMAKIKKKLSLVMLLVFLFANFLTPAVKTYAAGTVNLSISLENLISGTAPFNTSGGGAGDDLSQSDDVVRTLDVASYQFDYSINPAGVIANNLTLKFSISKDSSGNPIAIWDETAAANLTGEISADKTEITFHLGNVASGSAKKIIPVLKVLGNAKNGDTFNVSGVMTADNTTPVNIVTKTLTVSALPKFDLSKKAYSSSYKKGPNGEDGTLVTYSIEMVIESGKGSEAIKGDVLFKDDLSSYGIPNGRLYTWGTIPGIGINGDGDYIGSIPFGKLSLTSDKGAAVTDSGIITATQNDPGQPIQIRISNMDSSGNQAPIKNANNTSVDTSKKHVFAGYINLWFDNKDMPLGTTNVTNKFTALQLNSISGKPNFGNGIEPMANNECTHQVDKKEPGKASISYDSVYTDSSSGKLPTKTDYWTLDGTVLSGQSFAINNRLFNYEFSDVTGVKLITKIDSKTLEVVPKDNSTIGHTLTSSLNEENKYIVEYGTGNYDNYKEQYEDTGDNSTKWYTTINDAVASGTGPINKVRVSLKDGQVMKANEDIILAINVKAANNPIGTVIPMTTAVKASEVDGGAWKLGGFDPSVDKLTYTGDRVTVTGAFARISEEINKAAFKVREIAEFTLKPSLSTDGRIAESNVFYNLDIKETLPKGLTYVKGSAKQGTNSFEPIITKNADGSILLTWKIPSWEVGATIEPIKFNAQVNLNVTDNSKLESKAVIESLGDVSSESMRTSSVGLTITNSGEWGVEKTVLTPLVEKDEDISYLLKYYQTTENTYHHVVLIDILPFNGDGRIPATNFDGTYSLKEVVTNNGEKVYVTADDRSTILTDPNLNKSTWFDINDLNGPAKDKITAIKIVAEEFQSSEADREVKLTLKPLGNKKDNIYTNNFSGRLNEINKLVESNYVSAKVISSSIGQYVWLDKNLNGIKDGSEEGIKDVKLTLYDSLGNKVSETVTDANGNYNIKDLKSGTYTIKIDSSTLPPQLKDVFEKDSTFDGSVTFNLGKSEDLTDLNFGYVEKLGNLVVKYLEEGSNKELAASESSTKLAETKYTTSAKDIPGYKLVRTEGAEEGKYIEDTTTTVTYYYKKLINVGDFIWNDLNGDGKQDSSEPGIPGVVVELRDETGKVVETTTTDDIGHYNFNTTIGKYSVSVALSNFLNDNALAKFKPQTTNTVEGLKDLSADFKDFDFGYNKQVGTLIVKYVDENGKELLPSEISTKDVDTDYSTSKKDIKDYDFVKVEGNESGTYINGNITVTYIYKKKQETPVIKDLDKDSKNESTAVEEISSVVDQHKTTTETRLPKTGSAMPEAPYVLGLISIILGVFLFKRK